MNRLRRVTALGLSLLIVQLVLVGSGFTCVVGEENADAAMVQMGMGAMPPMPGMSGTGDQSPAPGSPSPSSDPCTLPWAPGGCTLMVPCAPHAMTARMQAIVARAHASHAGVAWEIAGPPSVIIALDTPPPRA